MKHLGSILTAAVFAFWGAMNSLVFLRQLELEGLDRYRSGVTQFLGTGFLRERWMGIYRGGRKIGYTGYTFEKVFALEGIEVHSTLESRLEIEVFGVRQRVEIHGTLVADKELKPLSLQLDAKFQSQPAVTLAGRRGEGKLLVDVKVGSSAPFKMSLPLEELHLGDALVPSLPIAGLRAGDELRVPCFDPITLSRSVATVRVLRKEVIELDGMSVEAHYLETTFRGIVGKSWVNDASEVLIQRFGPPLGDVVLRKERRENAQRPFKE
ncbi:MAG: hypothetical protein HY721_16230 [Planctomycetes bacterium]|nr:hypothetical protein [Planctomycetota bacterium]